MQQESPWRRRTAAKMKNKRLKELLVEKRVCTYRARLALYILFAACCLCQQSHEQLHRKLQDR
eukprot:3728088-Karenia_brevis.AAC.1